jgi:glucosamine--fructose-6-phosphate aminotransferase (isomerizing)
LIAVTNQPESPLGLGARYVLPQIAGTETTVATKTYVNSLACLWLLAQIWGGASLDGACDQLLRVADAMEGVITRGQDNAPSWIEQLGMERSLIFLGHGPHTATARQAAMMLGEWPKRLALASGIGAFRHGIIEIVQPETSAVFFGSGGVTRESTLALAEQLREQGARVLLVVDGEDRSLGQPAAPSAFGDFLAPLLDVIPVQLFAEGLALRGNAAPGFRYISKVVSQL